jgi:hypothetical protein
VDRAAALLDQQPVPGRVAGASRVRPGGSLDIELRGTIEALALVGDAREKRAGRERSPDFFTDTEVELAIEAEDPATALGYGGRISFDADPDDEHNTGEAWLFVNGGFGELRLGDDDGAAEQLALGGFSVAVASGGIDSDYIGTFEVTTIEGTGDATKVVYFPPEMAGLAAAISYTPVAESSGQDLARTDTGFLKDVLEVGTEHAAEIGELDVLTGLTALWGRFDTDAEIGGRSAWALQAGVMVEHDDYGLAAGFGTEDLGGFERSWVNIGAAWLQEPLALSLTYGRVVRAASPDGLRSGQPWNLVLGAEVTVLPGLVTSMELAWFDDSRIDDDADHFSQDDAGILGLARLGLSF